MSDPAPKTAVVEPPAAEPATPAPPRADRKHREQPGPPRLDHLPPFKVLLHNDAVNEMGYVVRTLRELTPLNAAQSTVVMMTAHTRGVALILVTHKERAELYVEQFRSKRLKVTIEPA